MLKVFDKQYSVEEAEFDPLALLLAGMEAPRKQSSITETVDDQTLFSDLDYIGYSSPMVHPKGTHTGGIPTKCAWAGDRADA